MNKRIKLLSIAFFLIIPTVASATDAGGELFIYSGSVSDLPEQAQRVYHNAREARFGVKHSEVVRVNVGPLKNGNPEVVFNLPDGRSYAFAMSRAERINGGRTSWAGQAETVSGFANLIVNRNMVTGSFNVGNEYFSLVPVSENHHAFFALDIAAFPGDGITGAIYDFGCQIPLLPGDCDGGGGGGGGGSPTPAPSTIRMLVMYTDNAAATTNNIDDLIQGLIDQTNDVFRNSSVDDHVQVELVRAAARVNYLEFGRTYGQHLDAMRNANDGYIDGMHNLRDYDKADVVALIVNDTDEGKWCGYADAILASQGRAFFVMHVGCNGNFNLTFPHELGHLFGAKHDRVTDPSSLPFTYGHGYRNATKQFRTIMAYECSTGCPTIPYFSNPDVTYLGSTTGTTTYENVARVIRNTAGTLAGFRTGTPGSTIARPTIRRNYVCYANNRIAWDMPGAASFSLYKSPSADMSNKTLVYSGSSDFRMVTYDPAGNNYYSARACVSDGCSTLSDTVQATYVNFCP